VFKSDNTILTNDSPKKSVCNGIGNSIFIKTWTRQAMNDDFLLSGLTLWLLCLHLDCHLRQLKDLINKYQIGVPPLAANSKLLLHIASRMVFSTRNVGL
jgi:hypothetical protein